MQRETDGVKILESLWGDVHDQEGKGAEDMDKDKEKPPFTPFKSNMFTHEVISLRALSLHEQKEAAFTILSKQLTSSWPSSRHRRSQRQTNAVSSYPKRNYYRRSYAPCS